MDPETHNCNQSAIVEKGGEVQRIVGEIISEELSTRVISAFYDMQDEWQQTVENYDLIHFWFYRKNGKLICQYVWYNTHPMLTSAIMISAANRKAGEILADRPLACWGGCGLHYYLDRNIKLVLAPDSSYFNRNRTTYNYPNFVCEVASTETLANMLRSAQIHLSGFGNRMVILINRRC